MRGIRHHDSFARSPEVTRFCSERGDRFTRARNARLIMSNTIPEMPLETVKPYCIWYPDVATEDTYRSLARRYPDMRYHVGRACAVAGYKTLYDELDLLPDVSIAEEARDNGHMDIFEAIVSQKVRYAVMNDYERTVDLEAPIAGVYLNGDTAVRSSLQSPKLEKGLKLATDSQHYFDIQEDQHVGPYLWPGVECSTLEARFAELAYMPLPQDLPALNKDVLIILAAWDGNVERYSRLRRPKMIHNELSAVLRGIYHHTPFARWLATRVDDIRPAGTWSNDLIWQAIHARSIMNGDLSRITSETDGNTLPAFFWWPHHPHEYTLRELAWRRPDLRHQVSLACIASNYMSLYDELTAGTTPTEQQYEVASQSKNPHYHEDICRRVKEQGIETKWLDEDFNWEKESYCPWPTSYSRRYLRLEKEMPRYEFSPSPKLPAYFINEPDENSLDWDVVYSHPPGDPLSLDLQEQMSTWMCLISATNDARLIAGRRAAGQKMSRKTRHVFLYVSPEDEQRRLTPAPEPPHPKNFEDDEY
ncbi:hypothetical protein LZ30DRAFT_747205 [Colletotrichum cereale]|nr:hypothetical protein LZ30DRAFT_747205 [Colletotrichum cereale]